MNDFSYKRHQLTRSFYRGPPRSLGFIPSADLQQGRREPTLQNRVGKASIMASGIPSWVWVSEMYALGPPRDLDSKGFP
jgi:hypothetical protein